MQGIPLDKDPHSLSGGYKRRLALAIQLVNLSLLLPLWFLHTFYWWH